MRADDLRLEEVVSFSEGSIELHGRRLVLHSINAMAQFRKDLVEMVGLDGARRILTRFGYFWGHADAAAMKRVFEWDSPDEWLKAGPRMHTMQGVARAQIVSFDMDIEAGKFNMEIVWRDSGEVEEHLLEFGQADQPICWMLAGYASGYASFCMGRDVFFIERKCEGCGDKVCRSEGRDAESWGGELEPYLPYFKAEDIQGKIQNLTRELRSKTRELDMQAKRLAALENAAGPNAIEARSATFRRVLELAERVARYDTSLLITGESGVGKEVLARHIHAISPRANRSFLAVNCAALPETLLDSELFGHKSGSFTGATRDRAGLFEEAAGGTIFLDEIGDISQAMQLKLLRALQEKEIMRVGESRPRKIDVRVIAATNRDLERAMRDGRFREDLFYRLRVIEINVPPLRERREDILPLARYFVKRLSGKLDMPGLRLDATCLDRLQAYRWPGNVRELENALERAAVLSLDGVIRPSDLPPPVVHYDDPESTALGSLEEAELAHIRRILRAVDGNRTRAAKILGISPTTLWRKIKNIEDLKKDNGRNWEMS